jgi:hypothetical protein
VGGWSVIVHSALRPPISLLCQPRVIMMMEKLVEWWLAGETEVLGENLSQCRFVHHKTHMPARMRTRAAAVGSQRLTAWATARPLFYASVRLSFRLWHCILLGGHFIPENGGNTFHRNAGNRVPDFIVSQARRPHSKSYPLWKPLIPRHHILMDSDGSERCKLRH